MRNGNLRRGRGNLPIFQYFLFMHERFHMSTGSMCVDTRRGHVQRAASFRLKSLHYALSRSCVVLKGVIALGKTTFRSDEQSAYTRRVLRAVWKWFSYNNADGFIGVSQGITACVTMRARPQSFALSMRYSHGSYPGFSLEANRALTAPPRVKRCAVRTCKVGHLARLLHG